MLPRGAGSHAGYLRAGQDILAAQSTRRHNQDVTPECPALLAVCLQFFLRRVATTLHTVDSRLCVVTGFGLEWFEIICTSSLWRASHIPLSQSASPSCGLQSKLPSARRKPSRTFPHNTQLLVKYIRGTVDSCMVATSSSPDWSL